MSSEPPEEPQYRNEPSILSPASPKPIHFPTPTNIPVLEMQHDEGFNQTETHMNDPASRNTELRPNLWRDPNEEPDSTQVDEETSAQEYSEAPEFTFGPVTPFSTGAEDTSTMELDTNTGEGIEDAAEQQSNSVEAASVDDASTTNQTSAPEPAPSSLHAHPTESARDLSSAMEQTDPSNPAGQDPPSDPSVPAADIASAPVAQAALSQDEADAQSSVTAAPAFNPTSVDVQALLDSLQTSPSTTAHTAQHGTPMTLPTADNPSSADQVQPAVSSPTSASGFSALNTGLPPRPPPQEQPLIHPNYVHSQHIRDYHPHAANPAFLPPGRTGSSGNVAESVSRNFVPPVHSPTAATASASGVQQQSPTQYTSTTPSVANGQTAQAAHTPVNPYSTSPTATNFGAYAANSIPGYGSSTATPIESRREYKIREGEQPRPEDRPWDAAVQRKYDQFIEEERRYVSEGRWEQFPNGARLFVGRYRGTWTRMGLKAMLQSLTGIKILAGNLSSEKVTKRDIFHVFHTYGELAQISIKQAYGFVQFLRAEDCQFALESEQGTQIRDKRIHLEVSKPQKNRPQNNQRRSRSPPDRNRGRPGNNVDRYATGTRGSSNNNNNRDAYRPGHRSPSPRGYRDRYDDRYRGRSRTPPYGRGGGNRYPSPSPRRDADDDLPLPKRNPRDVPDVQIIVLDQLDRDFISWVESAFTSRSVRADVLLLSPRLSEQAVVKRQIVEGVVAVVKLTRLNQNSGKIGLQIFDRSKGVSNVSFEEYDGLDPNIAVELVLRAKSTNVAPAVQQGYNSYGGHQQYSNPAFAAQPSYNAPSQSSYPPQQPTNYGSDRYPQSSFSQSPTVPPNLQSLITNLDPNNLQSLLSAMNTPQSGAGGNPYPSGSAPASAVQALQQNPAMVSYLQQQHAQAQQQQQQPGQGQSAQGQVNMQDILARLGGGNYQR